MTFEEREDVAYVASITECTGLVPALDDGEGDEDERALYAVQRAKCPRKRKN